MPGADLLGQRFGGGAGAVGDQPFGETLGNDVLHFLPHQFVAAVAKLFLRLHIQQDDLSALIHHHHGVGGGFEQPAIAAFHLRQMVFRVLAHADVADRSRHQRPFGAFSGLSMISIGNSLPSLRRRRVQCRCRSAGPALPRRSGGRRRSAVRRSPRE